MGGLWWAFDYSYMSPKALDTRALPWLLANGTLAMAGQIAMTRAYSAGKTLFASNLMYLTVVFSAFLGAWFTHDVMDALSYIGVAVIVGCSVAATVLNMERSKA
jgi:S-adenosylmethionine uptake transporter